MKIRRYGLALAAVATASLAITGCAKKPDSKSGSSPGASGGGVAAKAKSGKLVIGVKYDQPSLGLKGPNGPEGFDVDVAKYIAKKLGVTDEKNIEFKEAVSANRESFLDNGTVDMVIATYSITAARLPKVTYGGPYIITHQDIMVRANDSSIKDLASLKGKNICAVKGSNSWKNITDGTNKLNVKVAAKTVDALGYKDCITKLKGGTLDAVSTDATILAGFASQDRALKVVNAPFTDEKYGIGLKKGDLAGCKAVNDAVTAMYGDGTAKQLWTKWFAKAGLPFDAAVPPAQGCA
ncbi:MAG: extracellular solute-binding protein family 3 [Actinomycetia bacterium]|nr:extracellular solute-binding protein family 3 [Actinomycetes bacterium]